MNSDFDFSSLEAETEPCVKCGTELSSGSLRCSKCGHISSTVTRRRGRKKNEFAIILLGITAVIQLIVAVLTKNPGLIFSGILTFTASLALRKIERT